VVMTSAELEGTARKAERSSEPSPGIEPGTYGLRNRCSTAELRWRKRVGRVPDAARLFNSEVRALGQVFGRAGEGPEAVEVALVGGRHGGVIEEIEGRVVGGESRGGEVAGPGEDGPGVDHEVAR